MPALLTRTCTTKRSSVRDDPLGCRRGGDVTDHDFGLEPAALTNSAVDCTALLVDVGDRDPCAFSRRSTAVARPNPSRPP
jgi:hypothetical protein